MTDKKEKKYEKERGLAGQTNVGNTLQLKSILG